MERASGSPAVLGWQERRIIAVPLAILAMIGVLAAYLLVHERHEFGVSRLQAVQAVRMLDQARVVQSDIQNAETGQRGYLLTNNAEYLKPYASALTTIPSAMQRLAVLAQDNPVQAARVRRLDELTKTKLDELSRTVALNRAGRGQEVRALLATNFGENTMARIRAVCAEIISDQSALVEKRRAENGQVRGRITLVMIVASLIAVAGLTYALVAIVRVNAALRRREAERDAAETARRGADALYRAIFTNAADYLFVVDVTPDGKFVLADANPAWEAVLGRRAGEVRGTEEVAESDPESVKLIHGHFRQVVASGSSITFVDPVHTVEGPRMWETTLAPMFEADGRVCRIVGSARDVSARARAEEQIRRAQRMEAVGQLTGGVAHDFNNLLQVIRGNLEMLASRIGGDEVAQNRLKGALHGADRAAQLTKQLLAFARRQPLEPTVVNLGRLIGDMSDLLRRSLGESIEVETVIAGGLWNTLVDAAQVESAVLNLAFNARDAMPGGGRLTLEATNAVLDEAYVRGLEDVTAGQYVQIALTDSGSGMPPEVLARAFEPFFTTKGDERGTGLGLSMVYGFVKQSKGHLQIYSESGQGTTVKIFLPRSHRAEDRPAEPAPIAEGQSRTVLVVEDDAAVRAAARAMLEELGWRCIEAGDAKAARDLIEQGADIQLLFTDVIMPGPVKTTAMVARARELHPHLPVLFTSGYTENAIVHQGRLDPDVSLLSKPYGKDQLAMKIDAACRAVRPVVLVVEDDPMVRLAAIDMIEELGFTALHAGTAKEALEKLERESRVDVLFTDIGLPDMRGQELARAATQMKEGLKVVFASGYADDGSSAEDGVWLSKPYERAELAGALRDALKPQPPA